jgi:ATP-dependent protease ClpP protease subunit
MDIGPHGLLERFQAVAARHGITSLPFLADLVQQVPVAAFSTLDFSREAKVWLVGEIGGKDQESMAMQFALDITSANIYAPQSVPIQIYLSSPGGDVDGGLLIQAAISQARRSGRKVHIHVMGYAMSAAFDVVQVCDYRTAEPNAAFMTHEEQFGVEGSSSDVANTAAFSQKMEKIQWEILTSRTGQPAKYYQDKTKSKEWYMTAKEALAEGFIDEIIAIPSLPKAKNMKAPTPPKVRNRKVAAAVEVVQDQTNSTSE